MHVAYFAFFFLCWQEFQEQMKGASFKDVVIRGKELSGALITALINVYIKDNAPVDAISNHLRDICPLLYSSDDSVCSKVHINGAGGIKENLTQMAKCVWYRFESLFLKIYSFVCLNVVSLLSPNQANELLQSSKQIQNKAEKERTLRESLQLYQQISQHTDLPLVCSQYRQGRDAPDFLPCSVFVPLVSTDDNIVSRQCVSTRACSSCAWQQQTKRIHRDWVPTSTRTESLRRTERDNRPSRRGNRRKKLHFWVSSMAAVAYCP